jgi:MFS family permease
VNDATNTHVASTGGSLPRAAAWALLLCSSLTVLSGAIIAPALPLIAEEFKAVPNVEFLSRLVITMPALAIALTGMLSGLLADRIGRRPLLIGALALYAIAGTSGLYLSDLHAILAGRFVLGVAVAGVMTAASAMIGDRLAGPTRRKFLGRQAAFMSAGGVVFVPLGGLLTGISYHAPFAVYAASLLLLPLVVAVLPESRNAAARASAAHASAATHAAAPRGAGVTIAAIFVLAVLFQIAFYLGPVQVPFMVKSVLKGSGLIAGVAVAVMTLGAAVVSLNYERLARGRSPWMVASVTAAVMGVGCVVTGAADSLPVLLIGQLIFGIGAGLIMPNLMSWLMATASETRRGQLTGTLTAAIFAGQFLSPIAAQPLVHAHGVPGTFTRFAFALFALALVVLLIRVGLAARARRAGT